MIVARAPGCMVSVVLLVLFGLASRSPSEQPNILLIYADDLGYGDVRCYNRESKVDTPHIDKLANQGIRFTDAHSAATVCTPSRYSLLTGRYAFRLANHGRVFTGIWGPNLIDQDRLSLPAMLKRSGYTTACYGKWHLGMTFFDSAGEAIHQGGKKPIERIDYTRAIQGSPIHRGFDFFFGTVACPTTDWFYAFVDQDCVPNPPQKPIDKSTLPIHPYSRDCRNGWIADDFEMEEIDNIFLRKSCQFIERHAKETSDRPFFLYHSTQAVHLPSFAGRSYQGATQAGPHGDFIHQLDDHVGKLMETLEENNYTDNTIVIFTSDNGPEVPTVFQMRTDHKHDGARPWRGVKRDTWEGGHRVPMIVRWPGQSPTGCVSDQLFCQTDVMATLAKIVGCELNSECAEDSFDMTSAWTNETTQQIRPHIIHQGFAGDRKLAIRKGNWKYLNHTGSGGNNYANSKMLKHYQLPNNAPNAPAQLYNLETDPGETVNLYFEQPEIVDELDELLTQLKSQGHSLKR